MSVEDVLERANDAGFRLHQCYQRHPVGKEGKTHWYFDVVLVHTSSVWDYFNGQGDDLEEALLNAYRKGKAKLRSLEGMSRAEFSRERHPMQKLKEDLGRRGNKRRVRL